MIIKNEEKYLAGCLESVKNIVDEIIIVDTGSTDNSLKIAEKYKAKIFHYNWINDFSAARNYALSKIENSGGYVLYLDADERLSEESADELLNLTSKNKLAGYNCTVESPSQASGGTNVMKYIRLFANYPKIKFEGKAHEQIENSLLENGFSIYDSGIKIIHLGYDVSEEELKMKARRNLELLIKDYEIKASSYNAFQIGQTYVVMGELLKSEPYFIFAAKNKNLKISQLAHCYRYLAAIESNVKNDLDKSIEYLNEGLNISPKQPLLNVIASNVYLRKNNFILAEKYARNAFEFNSQIIGNHSNDFEIKIKNEDLLNHVLNVAMLSCNVSLFNDYYRLHKNEHNESSRNKLLLLFNSVFNNYSIENEIVELAEKVLTIEFVPAFVFSLNKYENINTRIKILEQIKAQYPDDIRILNMLGNSYLEIGEKNNAFNNFEKSFIISNNDQALLFSLITLSAELNLIDKLLMFIEAAQNLFKDNKAILEKLQNIKAKINPVAN